MKTIETFLSIKVNTDKTSEEVFEALKKGIYYGLDIKRVAPPKDINIRFLGGVIETND